MSKDLKVISVSNIFENINESCSYLVPIYQRNYAWGETQIEQLIEDIEGAVNEANKSYFLGNLIVNQRDTGVYEVIDGQQRLTTLYLIELYLGKKCLNGVLKFEARKKSNRTFNYISNLEKLEANNELLSQDILNGFKIIDNYFKRNMIKKCEFIKKLESVFLIRVQVPKNIDLNHYFEIMNTRGEQLELHEIAKAKLLEVIKNEDDKNIAALIWEKCSHMNSYIQMNFNVNVRSKIFTDDWGSLKKSIKDFNSLKRYMPISGEVDEKKSLIEILKNNKILNISNTESQEKDERFESIISFPNFLLQVNSVVNKLEEEDSTLDDKELLNKLKEEWSTEEKAKDFIYHLLKCRVLFDKYILKREFARDYKNNGKWSLQRLEKYYNSTQNSNAPKYINTFDDQNNYNKRLRTLESCLRITYTSPKTMYWISVVLCKLLQDETIDIVEVLEDYCNSKINASHYENKKGFEIQRIVFSYLDYLIYRDGYSYNGKKIILPFKDDWEFQFRNSIEHFYPQHPIEGKEWEENDLNGLGNLALITVSGNSKFSNLSPVSKISSYKNIVDQSLKLKIMEQMTRMSDGKWTEEKANIHKEEMVKILKKTDNS